MYDLVVMQSDRAGAFISPTCLRSSGSDQQKRHTPPPSGPPHTIEEEEEERRKMCSSSQTGVKNNHNSHSSTGRHNEEGGSSVEESAGISERMILVFKRTGNTSNHQATLSGLLLHSSALLWQQVWSSAAE